MTIAELGNSLTGKVLVDATNPLHDTCSDLTTSGVSAAEQFAGDDAAAKATVASLVESLAFRPVDLGGLRMARALEEPALVNISLNAGNGWAWQSAFRLVGPKTQAA